MRDALIEGFTRAARVCGPLTPGKEGLRVPLQAAGRRAPHPGDWGPLQAALNGVQGPFQWNMAFGEASPACR